MVDVVEGERPLQLVLRRPLRDHGEELHEVAEGDPPGPVPDDEDDARSDASSHLFDLFKSSDAGGKWINEFEIQSLN